MKLNTNVKVEKNEDESYAKFIMEPLDKGYGVTLGNSIRRVLLSSLEGAAITAIRIEGIDHEFGTIEGIKEDIVNIILNLKRIRLRSFADGPKKIFLKASKKGVVLAKDITVDADVEIVNKKQKICTITGSSVNLEIDIRVERGSGYQLSVANHYEDMPVGTIPVDSTFSPVVKVNHLVVDTRVGTRTDLDKLTLEVTTDGTITGAGVYTGTGSSSSIYPSGLISDSASDVFVAGSFSNDVDFYPHIPDDDYGRYSSTTTKGFFLKVDQ